MIEYALLLFRAKLGDGLISGKYSIAPPAGMEDEGRQGIPPRMFKVLIGRGNPTFASNRQQDAQEFLLHLINIIDVRFASPNGDNHFDEKINLPHR